MVFFWFFAENMLVRDLEVQSFPLFFSYPRAAQVGYPLFSLYRFLIQSVLAGILPSQSHVSLITLRRSHLQYFPTEIPT